MPTPKSSPQSGPTAQDQSETGPDTVTDAAAEPTPTAEAAATGGSKLIRTLHPGDRFVYDRAANDADPAAGVLTGTYQEFPATKAKELIAAAAGARVRILVADKES